MMSFRIALFIFMTILISAIFAPYFVSNQPYYYVNESGEIFYPIFEENTEFKNVDFKSIQNKNPHRVLMPLVPYSPYEYNLEEVLQPPSLRHIMGTDEQGRDVLSRLIYGARVSLFVGLVSVLIYSAIGILIGALAGFFQGRIDMLISRFIEVVICFPTFFLILCLLSLFSSNEFSLLNIMIVISLTSWTGIARMVRGEFLKLAKSPYILSAKAMGYSKWRILFFHMLPNAVSNVLVLMIFGVGSSILIESSLSYLGFGVSPLNPSWGSMLNQAREFMDFAWWLSVFPGLAIFLTLISIHILGEKIKVKA